MNLSIPNHILITAGNTFDMSADDRFSYHEHVDVLESADVTVTCNWYNMADAGNLTNVTLTLPVGRYDMGVNKMTVISGVVHLAKL